MSKDRKLRLGERIEATNLSQQKLERVELDGREVWRRTIIQRVAGSGEELITAFIYMELVSLRPIRAMARQPGGNRVGFEYDWDEHVIRPFGAAADTPPIMSMDLVMLEAAAHGRCVVAREMPANREVLGEAMIAFEGDSADALGEAILRCLSDPKRRHELAAAARRRVVERFAWPRVAAEYESVYQCAARAQRPRR